jgi:DNA-binding PadR family transcriptional regulator
MPNPPSPTPSYQDHLPLNPKVFMVLMALAEGSAHGYEIKKRAEVHSHGAIRLDAGSLYRTLAQLETKNLIQEARGRPDPRDDDARRRYYEMTQLGRGVLGAEVSRLASMVELARANQLVPQGGGPN